MVIVGPPQAVQLLVLLNRVTPDRIKGVFFCRIYSYVSVVDRLLRSAAVIQLQIAAQNLSSYVPY